MSCCYFSCCSYVQYLLFIYTILVVHMYNTCCQMSKNKEIIKIKILRILPFMFPPLTTSLLTVIAFLAKNVGSCHFFTSVLTYFQRCVMSDVLK